MAYLPGLRQVAEPPGPARPPPRPARPWSRGPRPLRVPVQSRSRPVPYVGHSFRRPPSADVPWVSIDADRWEGRTHLAVGPNVGDGGNRLFVPQIGTNVSQGQVLWQCL